MTITRIPERVVWALYSAPAMRPVMFRAHRSYCHTFQAFHATNYSPALFESFLWSMYTVACEFNRLNALLNPFLDTNGTCLHSISPPWEDIYLPMLRMCGLHGCRSWPSCHDSCSWCEFDKIFRWLLTNWIPGWSPKRLFMGVWIVFSTIILIVKWQSEVIIQIVVIDRSSPSLTAWRERSRRTSVLPLRNYLKRRQIKSMGKWKEWLQEMGMNVY